MCPAYVSLRQSDKATSSGFPASYKLVWRHSHDSDTKPSRAVTFSFTQRVEVFDKLRSLPLASMSIGMLTAMLRDLLADGLSPNDAFGINNKNADASAPAHVSRNQVRRLVGATDAADAVHGAHQAVELLRKFGDALNKASEEKTHKLFTEVVRVGGEDVVVVVTEVGRRGVEALYKTEQIAVVFNIDATHSLHRGSLLVTTMCSRLGGQTLPILFLVHTKQTEEVFTVALQRAESVLRIKDHMTNKTTSFMSDNCPALRNALRAVYGPDTFVAQCLWHALKAIRLQFKAYADKPRQLASSGTVHAVQIIKSNNNKNEMYSFVNDTYSEPALRTIKRDLIEFGHSLGGKPMEASERNQVLASLDGECKKKDLIGYINSKLSRIVREGNIALPSVPQVRDKASSADKMPQFGADGGATDADMNDFYVRLCSNGQTLMQLVYKVVNSPTEEEYESATKQLKQTSLLCGMGRFTYDYLMGNGGYLSEDNARCLVLCFTQWLLNDDRTNNAIEQLHRIYADVVLRNRRSFASLDELLRALVSFVHKEVARNLSLTVYESEDSSPYTTARARYNVLAARSVGLTVTFVDATTIRVLSATSKLTHEISVASGLCSCFMFAAIKVCRHVAHCETTGYLTPARWRANSLDSWHKNLMKWTAIGPLATEVGGSNVLVETLLFHSADSVASTSSGSASSAREFEVMVGDGGFDGFDGGSDDNGIESDVVAVGAVAAPAPTESDMVATTMAALAAVLRDLAPRDLQQFHAQLTSLPVDKRKAALMFGTEREAKKQATGKVRYVKGVQYANVPGKRPPKK